MHALLDAIHRWLQLLSPRSRRFCWLVVPRGVLAGTRSPSLPTLMGFDAIGLGLGLGKLSLFGTSGLTAQGRLVRQHFVSQ
jgi:hypothetical protein